MAGQIIPRGRSKWLVRIYVGLHPKTGKHKYVGKVINGTKKDAQAYLNATLREQDMGQLIEPTKLTLKDYLDRWLTEAASIKLRERTYREYVALLGRYAQGPIGEMRLKELTPVLLQSLYADLMKSGGPGVPSIRKLHVVLSSALDQAVRWGLLPNNPATSVQLPRAQGGSRENQIRVMSPQDALRFLDTARAFSLGTLFSFALNTGMRPGEYLALQWTDIDWKQNRVQVCRTLYRPAEGGWRFEAPKTRRSYRSVSLAPRLMEELRAHADAQRPIDPSQPDLVFRTDKGTPYDSTNLLRRHLRPILRAAGLDPKMTLYSLRHSHATLLLAAGVNPKVVADRLGHASCQVTLDVYSHVLPDLQKDVATRLDELLY